MFLLHAFSHAWRQLHVFSSNSDWLVVLFTSVAIGQGNYFGFGFTTLNYWKLLYPVIMVITDINNTFKWMTLKASFHAMICCSDLLTHYDIRM